MLMDRARLPRPRRRLRPRGAALAAAAGAALALHALLLGSSDVVTAPAMQPAAPMVTVRALEPVVAPAALIVAEPAAALSTPTSPPPPRVRRVAAAPKGRVETPATVAADAPPASVDAVEVVADAVKPVAGPESAAASDSLPVYRATPAPPVKLHYEMKRGMFTGSGDLIWKPAGERYELRLEASVAGLQVLTETSDGQLGAQGLAPLRYTDWRIRRGTSAANFQRDKGKITYSGPQVEFPLAPGAQDRLSWMLQIGAVLNAEPQRAAPGEKLVFFVTGARGDADAWTFRFVGVENVSTPNGAIRAVKFTREPRQTYDRLVEVWLAPARQHLPVRARFSAQADGEVFELLLRDIRAP